MSILLLPPAYHTANCSVTLRLRIERPRPSYIQDAICLISLPSLSTDCAEFVDATPHLAESCQTSLFLSVARFTQPPDRSSWSWREEAFLVP